MNQQKAEPEKRYKKKILLLIFGILLVSVFLSSGNSNDITTNSSSTPANTIVTPVSQNIVDEPSKIPTVNVFKKTQIKVDEFRPITTQTIQTTQVVTPVTNLDPVPLSNDNYYINSKGNEVHSPAYAPSIPSGASARCRDGTYSFSQSRRGTCSHHGGVEEWY